MRKHQELRVWQQTMDLVEHVYTLTKTFPDDENTASPAKCEDVLSQFRAILQKGRQEEAPKNSSAFCIYLKVL